MPHQPIRVLIGPPVLIPLMACPVAAGFPSPAEDYVEQPLDLNQHLIERPAATMFIRVEGESMTGAGIYPNDLLVVDKAEPLRSGRVVVAAVDGEFVVKRYVREPGRVILKSENPDYPPLVFEHGPETELMIEGVVLAVIHRP
jgi:DNA polymerase V